MLETAQPQYLHCLGASADMKIVMWQKVDKFAGKVTRGREELISSKGVSLLMASVRLQVIAKTTAIDGHLIENSQKISALYADSFGRGASLSLS